MTRQQRASQIWALLICAAYERKTYTYGGVASILGFGGAGVLSQILELIMCYCRDNNLPPLTALVVNQDTGLPGDGLTTLEDLNRDREAVFKFKWFELEPPQNSDFSG